MEIHEFKEPNFDFDNDESNFGDELAILETPIGSLQNIPKRTSCGSGNSVLLGLNDAYTDSNDDDEKRSYPSDPKSIQDTKYTNNRLEDKLDKNADALGSKEKVSSSSLDVHELPACTSVDIQSESAQIVESHDSSLM